MNDSLAISAPPLANSQEPAIELIDVHKHFGRQEVLRGINLTVYEGRTLVIVGASGQGRNNFV